MAIRLVVNGFIAQAIAVGGGAPCYPFVCRAPAPQSKLRACPETRCEGTGHCSFAYSAFAAMKRGLERVMGGRP
jgi:hypothetical protein